MGNLNPSPRMEFRSDAWDADNHEHTLGFHSAAGMRPLRPPERGAPGMNSDRFWLVVSFWLLLVIAAVAMLAITIANRF